MDEGDDSIEDYDSAGFRTVPRNGGAKTFIAATADEDVAFTASDTMVYWSRAGEGELWRASLRAPFQVMSISKQLRWDDDDYNGPELAVDDAAVYWTGAATHVEEPQHLQLLRTTCCGDGRVGGIEQCDDGNLTDGDGCSANCDLE